jgi:hypothetical protein
MVKTQLENMELFSIPALASTFVDYVSFLWNPISDLKGTTACDSRPGLGRIQGGSQGSFLNFHILVQCKYVFLLNVQVVLEVVTEFYSKVWLMVNFL